MPLYMDRHEIGGDLISVEEVAQVHQQDIELGDHYGVKMHTYWFDSARNYAFCLATAASKEAMMELHSASHGNLPHRLLEVDMDTVEMFLGRIEDPPVEKGQEFPVLRDSPYKTMMVIGIENFIFQNTLSEKLKSSLGDFSRAIRENIEKAGGRTVTQNLDYFLASFDSAGAAVKCAQDIYNLYTDNQSDAQSAFKNLRIGLSAGNPVDRNDNLFEKAIKLAERMCSMDKEGLVISSDVKKLCMSENLEDISRNEMIFTLTPEDEKFLSRLMGYTETIWNDPELKAENFHEELGFSKSQFYRKLTSLLGKSPNTFIKDYRLDTALRMLNDQKGNVSEIGFDSGFSSPSYFTKCFQKRFGLSPTEYLQLKAA